MRTLAELTYRLLNLLALKPARGLIEFIGDLVSSKHATNCKILLRLSTRKKYFQAVANNTYYEFQSLDEASKWQCGMILSILRIILSSNM
jgi:hypothetical protein